MDYEPGDLVERRFGRDESRFGRITGRVHEGYDTWYVTTGMGMTYCDNGRDLRRAEGSAWLDGDGIERMGRVAD